MNEKKKLQPKVRFREFTGENASDWEQRKLGDIYQNIGNAFVGTATPYYVDTGHFYLESNNIKDGKINRNNEIFINDEFYEKQKDKWLHTGDIVMVQSGHVGHSAVIPRELDNTAAHALIMFRNPKEKIDPYFLNFEYQTSKSKFKINNITTGNTIKHILASDMQKFIVDIPKYEEQKVIANIFRNLDILITLHQRELEQLEQLKNTLLSKMFPKSGTNIPEIRFSGFTDAWKHHKLGNAIEKNSLRNKDLLINNVESVSNKYGFIRQTEQFDDYTVASNDLSNYYIILEKFFAYNPSRINVGSIAYKTVGSPVSIVSPLYVSFSTKDIVDDRFLWYWFKTNEFKQQREKYSEGGVRDTLSYNQLSKMNILLPELNEQIKIGKYLDSLTKTIAIHQRKLEQLKNLKQTLLNKMFI